MNSHPDATISVLVVDHDQPTLLLWRSILQDNCYAVVLLSDTQKAIQHLETNAVDVAIIDLHPAPSGLELLSRIKNSWPETEVVMMAESGNILQAVEAMKRGAYDFLTKPFENSEAAEYIIQRAAERRKLELKLRLFEKEKEFHRSLDGIIGESQAIKAVFDQVLRVASSTATVLICGESGTGKELIARAIHENSPRRSMPLVTINCAALSESLLESELFGHVQGAFSGASAAHAGLFQAANKGTFFLDEIGHMPLVTQSKLLRALQEGEVRPVGAVQPVVVDVRFIAATNINLEELCQQGKFRWDLYHRLNVIPIDLPRLKNRTGDIALLAHYFLHKHERLSGKNLEGIKPTTLKRLAHYDWPGNVRELENVMSRAVALAPQGKQISTTDLPAIVIRHEQEVMENQLDDSEELSGPYREAKAKAVEEFERRYLLQMLGQHKTIHAAAKAAGIDRSSFRRLLRRYGISSK